MTTDSVTIAAAPEAVFAVLLDAHAYGEWVVGSNIIRRVDDSWPAIGSRFHHSIGAGPFNVNDSTEVIDVDPPHRLVLEARMRPFLTARVILESTRVPAGTCVTMTDARRAAVDLRTRTKEKVE